MNYSLFFTRFDPFRARFVDFRIFKILFRKILNFWDATYSFLSLSVFFLQFSELWAIFCNFLKFQGPFWHFLEVWGGGGVCTLSGQAPPQSNSPSRPGVAGSPSRILPVDQGLLMADFPFFFLFLCLVDGSSRPGGFPPSQSNSSSRPRASGASQSNSPTCTRLG